MKFGMMGVFKDWQVLSNFGEFLTIFLGAQIFDR